ncbi:oligosaccharide flippase family protein [Psychrobacillus sp. MER TA 171]|uniref:lipopolysaccharide biosynthesis protein n=1 Tax=Psychrobacillus sp. MER TA 171 TaxID=2939577 RepID=UPI00203D4B8C|nr:oligosaccharide flippase family protein [Psychrobacillus sp. MER TA 171]MCM3356562.1 oligosaccharide flippase family protein [Psychrobacillus sp. MER TA 171]
MKNNINTLLKNSIKNMFYTFSVQSLALIINMARVLLIPKVIGIEDYSYWQLFLFYIGFVGFFHFGFNDGIYLRYGGVTYKELDKEKLRSYFYILVTKLTLIASGIIIYSLTFYGGEERFTVWIGTAICLIVNNIIGYIGIILQCTNKFKDYSKIILLDKLVFLILLFLLLFFKFLNYEYYIIAYVTSTFISLIFALYICRDLIFGKVISLMPSLRGYLINIKIGSFLMVANIASMLILGFGRFLIDEIWGINTFGEISLSISITSMLLIFINAISIVLFPALRQTAEENHAQTFVTIRVLLTFLLMCTLLLYGPIEFFLQWWLPEYSESLRFLIILFPLCIFEGKMQMLLGTYLKVLRYEKILLRVNLISLLISVLLCLYSGYILKDIKWILISMVVGIIIRSIITEFYLAKKFNVSFIKISLSEMFLTIIFMIVTWYSPVTLFSFFFYLLSLIIFTTINKREIRNSFNIIKKYF